MKKLLYALCLSALVSACFLSSVLAAEDPEQIPDQVSGEHWACKDMMELARKYGASGKPESPSVVAVKPYSKEELASHFLKIIDKVSEKCEKEGAEALAGEDREKVVRLYGALKKSLVSLDGDRTRRETIEKILAPPEEPPFEYKAGIKGFLRGERAGNFRLPDFSSAPNHAEGRFLYRTQPYVYWHPTDYLDIHVEGQGYGYIGGSQYSGRYSVYQAFLEGKIPEKEWLALKLGRQEFNYGSAFILGPDSFYNGLSFDAARLRVQPLPSLTVDLLGGFYATPFSDGLKGYLTGAYATYAFSEGSAIEAYAFRDTGSTARHAGEHLDIWGVRGTAKVGPVSLEIEPVYESGKVFNSARGTNDTISAYGGHLDASFEKELAGRKNRFFASYAYGSGSRDAANQISARGEFRTPDNDNSLVGDMSVIGDMSGVTVNGHHASGLRIHTLGWSIDVTKEVNFSATGRYFMANSVEGGFSRNLGLETDFTLTYNMTDNLSLVAGYDRFFTGDFFRNASGSGKDIDYAYVMLQFNFGKTKLKTAKKEKKEAGI